MIVEHIERFVRNPDSGDFDELVRGAFRFQFERLAAYRELCRRQGAEPDRIDDWREIPPIPALAFKTLELRVGEGGEVFRSSGTTAAEGPSVHHHAFPDLYRATIDASFPAAVLGSTAQRPILSLIPDRQQAPDSSLAFMIDHVLGRWGSADSITAFGPRGVDARRVRSFLGARQRDRTPTLVVATAFALVQLLEALERLDLRFRLPPGSVIFETGGYKGRSREVNPDRLQGWLRERLAVTPGGVVREYGMTELTSQFYSAALAGEDPFVFRTSPWTRVRVLDPETLTETPKGKAGLLAILDLANLSSAIHLLTEDLGVAEDDGFRLLGRAAGAELRGCSLTVDELSRS